ncbi:MAG: hypothetical protein LLG05_07715 [Porphyromonadaceae bacterium]|nr:hypothetical protein [Porphyromonadaceae bacterium]
MGRYDNDSTNSTGLFDSREFKGRGVIKVAPDAFVYVNRNLKAAIKDPIKNEIRTVNFQDNLTSISVQNNVDPPGSSTASIEFSTPIYNENSLWVPFYFNGNSQMSLRPYFSAMMEVHIFFKGRFLVGSSPHYYLAFWGFVVNVEESFSNGAYKIQLQCADMLHWWQYIQISFRPSVEENIFVQGEAGITALGTRFNRANPFEIIYNLCQAMGMENFITPSFVGKQTSDPKTKAVDPRWLSVYYEAAQYWNSIFAGDFGANNLKMYGTAGQLLTPETFRRPVEAKGPNKAVEGTRDNIDASFSIDNKLRKYEIFFEFDQIGKGLSEAEYKTKLEVATEIKNRVEYEFFQDVNGNFIFKPPFYNLNVKTIYPYNIKPQDVINFSAAENSEEIVTAMECQVSPQQNIRDPDWINKVGYHVDLDLVKKYGFRYKRLDPWWLSETKVARSYAVAEMGLINAKAHTGSVTIPGRPELRLGYPIYMVHNDRFYYVKSINHAFEFGGSFTTTLSLEAERTRYYDRDKYQIIPNVVYKYKEPSSTDRIQAQADLIKLAIDQVSITQNIPKNQAENSAKNALAAIKKGKTVTPAKGEVVVNRFLTGDPKKNEQILLRATGAVDSAQPGLYDLEVDPTILSLTVTEIPLSDDEGYRVVGGFRYGRGIVLKPGQAIEIDETNDLSPSPQNLDRTPTTIASMSPESDKEGQEMSNYFAKSNQAGTEGIVNPHINFPDSASAPKPTTSQIANNLVNMTASGSTNNIPANTSASSPTTTTPGGQ